MFRISLEQGSGGLTMLAVTAAAVLLAGTFYWRAFGMLARGQRRLLLGLRIAAILLVVLLLFRPVLSYQRELTERSALVLVLDTSASMSIADDATGVTRFNQARARIDGWREKLRADFDLHLVAFAQRARALGQGKQELAQLAPDGQATSLGRGLSVAAKLQDANLRPLRAEAVMLFSDGIDNSALDPRPWARRVGAPVHTVGVGASLRGDVTYRDIQVTGIDCPDRPLLNNVAKITGAVEGVGLTGRVIQVVLLEDEKEIQRSELTLDGVEGSQQVAFEFRPTAIGRHAYTVRVDPASEERIGENNQRTAVAMVVEPGIRVLYVEGTMRAEYGALVQRFLSKDPDLEFCALVQTRPNVFLQRTNIPGLNLTAIPADKATIDTFDVFILGDLDASYLRPEQQQWMVERVRSGAGLVMLGGYHSLGPGGYAGTPLGEILPVLLGNREIGQITESFLPTLTPEGANHGIFANISGFFPTQQRGPKIEGLPLLDGCTRVQGPRPGASVLATFHDPAGAMPVLAVQPVERGRTAVFCCDTTRKWQQGPRAMDQESPFLRFWGQLVRWLAGRSVAVEAQASVTASTDKAQYQPGEPIQISAVVRDQQGEGAKDVEVSAEIRTPKGRSEKLALATVPGPAGHYGGSLEPETAGPHEIVVQTKVGDKSLSTDKIVVEVGRPNMEFERLDLDEKLLAQLAADAGGRYVHITTADYLLEHLDRSLRKRREEMRFPRYEWPLLVPVWLAFVGALTAEWVLRKRFQLR